MKTLIVWLNKIISKRKALARWQRIVTVLAALLTFATTYALILPAITVEKNRTEDVGGMYLERNEGTDDMLLDNALEPADTDILVDDNEDTDAAEPWTEAPEVGILKAVGDDYTVTLTYDATSGIPDGSALTASEIAEDSEEYQTYLKETKKAMGLKEEETLPRFAARFFDIKIMVGEEEFIPESGVSVEIAYAEPLAEKAEAEVSAVHFSDETGEAQVIEANATEVQDDGSATVEFTAESFSVYGVIYTVDFHWEVDGKTYEFSLPGGGFVSLEKLVETLGVAENYAAQVPGDVQPGEAARKFIADIVSVEFSNPELVDVSKAEEDTTVGEIKVKRGLAVQHSAELTEEQTAEIDAQTVEAGDWALIGVQPFASEETLLVTMKDEEHFAVKVTDYQISTSVLAVDGKAYKVTVTYDEKAEIPVGSKLSVRQLRKDNEEYLKAKSLLADNDSGVQNGDDGMLAFDISIHDRAGNLVEPKSKVSVNFTLLTLPEDADVDVLKQTMEVHHIVKDGESEKAVLVADVGIFSQGTVSVEKDGVTASFVTESFSVYTINWGYNSQTLRLHFVDEGGNDLTTDHTVTYNGTEVGGDTVSISNSNTGILQFNSDGELDLSGFKIDGYTLSNTHKGTSDDLYSTGSFRHTIIGNKLRWNNGNLQYQAFYTNTDKAGSGWYNVGRTPRNWNVNSDHIDVPDNQTSNSRDYYLVYDPIRPAGSGSSGTGGIDLEELPELEKSKSLSSNRDGTYNLSLSVADTAIKKEIDNDINVIIIIDTSSSMQKPTNTGNTRLYDTQEAVKALVSDLDDLNTSQNPDAVELALVTFNLNASIQPIKGKTWVTDGDDYNQVVDSIGTAQGTNWAQALQTAYTMKGHDNDPTYVLFLTDGAPSQYWQTDYSYYVDGEGCYLGAREEARRVATSGMYFYGVFAFGDSTDEQKGYLKHLANYAYNDPTAQDTYSFYVSKADALKNKLKEIVQTIKLTYGYSDVKIYDGITELTTVTFEHVDPESFTYTISYKDYTDPDDITVYEEKEMTFTADNNGTITIPSVEYGRLVKDDSDQLVVKRTTTEAVTIKGAEFNAGNGAADKNVSWNLQKPDGSYYILEDGWNYQVNFKIWPSQPTYDLIAALNNGILDWGDAYTYVDSSGIQQTIPFSKYESQIDKNGDSYSLKTNTEAYVTYKKVIERTRNGKTTYVEKDSGRKDLNQPPNMPLDNTWIRLKKIWNTTLSSEDYDKIPAVDLYVIEDPTEAKINAFNAAYKTYTEKQNPTPEETAAFEAAYYQKITLQKGNDWTGNLSIAPGIYDKDKKFKTTGHTYMVLEPGIDNHYELEATPTHPMLDGRTLDTQTDMVDTYESSVNPSPFEMDQETAVYSVANTLKAGINVYKYVQDASGEIEEDYNAQEFTFKISLFTVNGDVTTPVFSHNEEDGQGALAYRIFADTTIPEGAEENADGYTYKGYQYDKQFDDHGELTGYMARGSFGNTGEIQLSMRPYPSQFIRIVNVPLGTYYTVEETGGITGTGYEFVKVCSEAVRQGAVQGASETISAPNSPKTGRRQIVPDAANNVSFYNKRKIVDINIEKSDEDGKILPGAVFNLQAKNASNVYQDVTLITGGRGYSDIRFNSGKSGSDDEELGTVVIGAKPGAEGSGVTYNAAFTTPEYTDAELDEDPLMTLKHLPDGEYQLTEIKAPGGYVITLMPIDFKVENGVVTFPSSSNNAANGDKVTFTPAGEESLVKLEVENTQGASLPSTGGIGTTIFYLIGTLLTGIAGASLVHRKRRRTV